jgi:hypothetical protein
VVGQRIEFWWAVRCNPQSRSKQAIRWQATVAELLPLDAESSNSSSGKGSAAAANRQAGKASGSSNVIARVKLTNITAEIHLKYPLAKEAAEQLLPARVIELKAVSSADATTNGAWGPPRRQCTEQLPWLF